MIPEEMPSVLHIAASSTHTRAEAGPETRFEVVPAQCAARVVPVQVASLVSLPEFAAGLLPVQVPFAQVLPCEVAPKAVPSQAAWRIRSRAQHSIAPSQPPEELNPKGACHRRVES